MQEGILSLCHNSFVTIKTVWQCKQKTVRVTVYTLQYVPRKQLQKLHRCFYFHTSSVLGPMSSACWYGIHSIQQILSTTALLLGWPWLFATVCITVNTVAGQMEAHHNLHIQLFLFRMLYYNYILITGWLIQESRQKAGLCWHKKSHCGPVSEQVPFSSSRMRAWKRGLSKCWLCVRIQVAINVIVMAYHNLICYSNRQLHITSVPVW